jgi:chromosome segregation ATPase
MKNQREDYQKKIEAQLNEWRDDIDRLKVKAKAATAEAKQKYEESINKLELKMTEGKSKLRDLTDSSEDAWETVKEGADSIWDTMKATFSEVKEKFKDKEDK